MNKQFHVVAETNPSGERMWVATDKGTGRTCSDQSPSDAVDILAKWHAYDGYATQREKQQIRARNAVLKTYAPHLVKQ